MSSSATVPTNLDDEVKQLVGELGVSEDVAREVASTARRERLLKNDILAGGCLELADAMADVNYVMEPILVQRQVITATGRSGHGKSTVFLAVAFALSLDRDLGPLKPRRSGLVYFVSAEDTDGTRKRIYAEANRHQLNSKEREQINRRLRWVHVNVTMSPILIAQHIREDADVDAVSAIFIDTGLALFSGDDENANTQMQGFAMSCRSLTEINGAPCVVVFWHPVKTAAADNLTPRGGSALLNTIDGNLTLWLDAESDTATLGHTKWRADMFEPIEFALEVVPLVMPSGAKTSVKLATPKSGSQIEERESEGASRRQKLLTALLMMDGKAIAVRSLAEQVGTTKSTANRDLAQMATSKHPLVEIDPVTNHYMLTQAGKKAAEALRAREAAAYKSATSGG